MDPVWSQLQCSHVSKSDRLQELGSTQAPWATAGGRNRLGDEVCHLSPGGQAGLPECWLHFRCQRMVYIPQRKACSSQWPAENRAGVAPGLSHHALEKHCFLGCLVILWRSSLLLYYTLSGSCVDLAEKVTWGHCCCLWEWATGLLCSSVGPGWVQGQSSPQALVVCDSSLPPFQNIKTYIAAMRNHSFILE